MLKASILAMTFYFVYMKLSNKRIRFSIDQQLEKFKIAQEVFEMGMAIESKGKEQPNNFLH